MLRNLLLKLCKQKEKTMPKTKMSAWEMSCAVLVALNETHQKASKELEDKRAQAMGNPFGDGVSSKTHLLETITETLLPYQAKMELYAKANSLELPKLDRKKS